MTNFHNFNTLSWDLKVRVKSNLQRRFLVQKLNSRLVLATLLQFYGYKHEVCYMMQTINHTGRAFIFYAGGLPGFLK